MLDKTVLTDSYAFCCAKMRKSTLVGVGIQQNKQSSTYVSNLEMSHKDYFKNN